MRVIDDLLGTKRIYADRQIGVLFYKARNFPFLDIRFVDKVVALRRVYNKRTEQYIESSIELELSEEVPETFSHYNLVFKRGKPVTLSSPHYKNSIKIHKNSTKPKKA